MKESTKRHILIVAIVLSVLPAALLLQYPAFVSVSSLSLYISAIFGYIGVVLLLWMYILGAKGVMGNIFSDLAPVLRIHKWLGKYGTFAIFIHPILITFSYGESLLYSFLPLIDTWTQRHILLGQIAFWILLGIWFLSAYMRKRLDWRVWKYIHMLAYICVPFVLLHIPNLGSQQRAHALVNAYFWMLVATFAIISIIRLTSLFNLDRARYKVVRHTQITPIDYSMQLEPIGHRHLVPRFGQYIYVKLGFMSEDHPFSVTQYEPSSGVITVTYRLAGMYTQELSKVLAGSEVLLSGPYGNFMHEYGDDIRPVVYLAGGIGVTPFVDQITKNAQTREQWLFAANRSRELAVFSEQLKDALGERAVAVYSQVEGILNPGEESGYISADMLRKYLGDLSRYQFYICGPPSMMKAMYAMLLSAGVAPERVQSEKFGW